MDMRIYQKTHLTSSAQVVSTPCILRYITVNKTVSSTIVVNDDIGGATTTMATLQASVPCGTYRYDCIMATGIYVTLNGASDITVVYELL